MLKGMVKMHGLPEDVERMADYLGRDDPNIHRLLKIYVRDHEMRETVLNILKRRCVKAGFEPYDPPIFWPVRQLPAGRLQVGKTIQGTNFGPQFALPEDIITQHVGIFGHNGTGKSYLAMHIAVQAVQAGYKVWIFDIEDEYSRISPSLMTEKLVTMDPQQLRLNMFQPPGDWIKPSSWIDEINLMLRGGTFLRDGSLNLFRVGMSKIIERKGITAGSENWPSLFDVIEYFQGIRFGPKSRSSGFLESLLNRLVTLADTFEQIAKVRRSNMLQILSENSVIFRLQNLVGIPLQSLVSFLLLWLARFREGDNKTKPHIVIIEEAHMLASEKSRQDIGENILSRMFRTARKRGVSLILCDQIPGELPPAILGNLACRIVMRLSDAKSIWSIQSSMGLDRQQADAISRMKPRRAVVHYTLHPTPFEIEVPQLFFSKKTKEPQLSQEVKDTLSMIQWNEFDESNNKIAAARLLTADDLNGDALIVMMRICEAPAESISERCETLRIERAREFRARAELDGRGLIRTVEQTIGGKIKFFEPTDKGISWAQKRNVRIKKFKSGIVHEYILSQVEKCIGHISPKWRLQRNSSVAKDQGLQPDLLVLEPEGGRFIVEICCSNFNYDARNILAEAEIAGIDSVIGITLNKNTKEAIEEALKKYTEDSSKDWRESILLLVAAQCLADDFDWTSVFVKKL